MTEDILQGRVRFPAMPAAATSWRGLSLNLTNQFEYGTASSDVFPIPFDEVIADSDGIYNGTDGGLVPAGMSGLWRFGGHVFADSIDGAEGGLGSCFIQQTRAASPWLTWQSYYVIGEGGEPLIRALPFPFPSIISPLEEGDELQIWIGMSGGFTAFAEPYWTWMTMEYLGPTPEVS